MFQYRPDEIANGYRERIARLALFDPLYELERKTQADNDGKPIDFFGLGLLSLLFFFEQMLIRNRKTGVKELSAYLRQAAKNEINLDANGFENLARTIIHTLRPPHGKRRERKFFNWETKKFDSVQYSILKADSFDVKTNTQYYTLDDDGLELVFATKEYFSEFQLSINQLILRKQLEKGEFEGALRQINEMRIDVENLQQRIIKIKHEIQRNIISEETYSRFKAIIEDVYYRLKRENEEFKELNLFVKETKERLYYQETEKQEGHTYELVLKISKELEEVHYEHGLLLQESIELKTKALKAAQESLYYMGINSFNFDQEITARLVSSPLPLEAARGLAAPFLKVHKEELWSPLTVFAEQRIDEEEGQPVEEAFLSVTDEGENLRKREIQSKNFTKLMKLVIEAVRGRNSITLKEIASYVKETKGENLLQHRSFYDFFIILHQRSPLTPQEMPAEEHSQILDEALALLKGKKLTVTEEKEILELTDRYSIQNMIIKVEEI